MCGPLGPDVRYSMGRRGWAYARPTPAMKRMNGTLKSEVYSNEHDHVSY